MVKAKLRSAAGALYMLALNQTQMLLLTIPELKPELPQQVWISHLFEQPGVMVGVSTHVGDGASKSKWLFFQSWNLHRLMNWSTSKFGSNITCLSAARLCTWKRQKWKELIFENTAYLAGKSHDRGTNWCNKVTKRVRISSCKISPRGLKTALESDRKIYGWLLVCHSAWFLKYCY